MAIDESVVRVKNEQALTIRYSQCYKQELAQKPTIEETAGWSEQAPEETLAGDHFVYAYIAAKNHQSVIVTVKLVIDENPVTIKIEGTIDRVYGDEILKGEALFNAVKKIITEVNGFNLDLESSIEALRENVEFYVTDITTGDTPNAGSYRINVRRLNQNHGYQFIEGCNQDVYQITPRPVIINWGGDYVVENGVITKNYRTIENHVHLNPTVANLVEGTTCSLEVEYKKGDEILTENPCTRTVGTYSLRITGLNNSNYQLEGGTDCAITLVRKPRQITVEIDNIQMVYGERTKENLTNNWRTLYPNLYRIIDTETQEVAEDIDEAETIFTLSIGEYNKTYLEVGSYLINGILIGENKDNYEIIFKAKTEENPKIVVEPKEVSLRWQEQKISVYTGLAQSLNVAVMANSLVGEDECTIECEGSGINVGNYEIKAVRLSNPNYKLPSNATETLEIIKATPKVISKETVRAQLIQRLKTVEIKLSMDTSGNTAWENPEQILGLGNHTCEIIFIPVDTTNYNTVAVEMEIIVEELSKTDGKIDIDDGNYEDIKDIVKDYDDLTDEEKENLDSDTKKEIEDIKKDLEDYEKEHGILATPTITKKPVASSIKLGQNLENSILSEGTANVEGTFGWTNFKTIPSLGTNQYEVTFTPSVEGYTSTTIMVEVTVEKLPKTDGKVDIDDGNYEDIKDIVKDYDDLTDEEKENLDPDTKKEIEDIKKDLEDYEEEKKKPQVPTIINIPSATAIRHGQKLGKSLLNGGTANVEGTFEWTNSNIIPSLGTNRYEVTFTPSVEGYTSTTIMVEVMVEELPKTDGKVDIDDGNYEDIKDIVKDYDDLTDEEKENLDPDTKKEIEEIKEILEQYENQKAPKKTKNIALILWLSIGGTWILIIGSGVAIYFLRKKKRA